MGKQTITAGISTPTRLALDALGNLYVVNTSDVTVYAPTTTSVLRTVSGVPILIDASGWFYNTWESSFRACLYRACALVFHFGLSASAPYPSTQTQQITLWSCGGVFHIRCPGFGGLALDRSQNVYAWDSSCPFICNNNFTNRFSVWAQGLASSRTGFSESIMNIVAMAFDASGMRYEDDGSVISEYAPLSATLVHTITGGISSSTTLAVDNSNNLYVANGSGPSITVYAPGQTSVLRTITKGITAPKKLGFDRFNNLYVLNGPSSGYANGSVSIYAPGAISPSQVITGGIYNPTDMVVQP
jgi:hypothetical protein